jgi:hypothetical protein
MINMTLKSHHQNISNKITIFISFSDHLMCFLARLIVTTPRYNGRIFDRVW